MNEEELTKLINDKGFTIADPVAFFNGMTSSEGVTVESVINELSELEEKIENSNKVEAQNFFDFLTGVGRNLWKIDSVVKKDNYFTTALGGSDFLNQLESATKNIVSTANEYSHCLNEINEDETRLANIKIEIDSLKNGNTFEDNTLKTVELLNEFQKISRSLDNKKQHLADLKKQFFEDFENNLKTEHIDIAKYEETITDKLKSDIIALDEAQRKLSFEVLNREKLRDLLIDTRNNIVLFEKGIQKDEKRYNELCEKFGLGKVVKNRFVTVVPPKNLTETLGPDSPQPDAFENFDRILNQNTGGSQPEETKDDNKEIIVNQDQLAKKIKELNPFVETENKEVHPLVEIKYDALGHAESIICENPEALKLPEGFKYTEGLGFNNKVSDGQGFINLTYEPRKNRLAPAGSLNTPEVEENKEISSLEDLIYEIKKLNPSAEVIVDSEGKAIGIKTDKPEELKLPNGYSYDKELGINNKKDNEEKFMKIPVSVKAKETEKVEKTDTTTKSSIPEGKVKVKKTRKAILAPYGAAILKFGALGGGLGLVLGASAGVGFAAGLPVALAGAAIGAIGQTIYNKIVLSGKTKKVDGEELFEDKNVEIQEWSSAGYKSLKDKTKVLWKMLKEKMKNKEEKRPVERKAEVSKPEVVNNPVTPEQTDSLLEYLEAQNQLNLDDDQIDYDSILDWNLPDEGRGR